MTRIKGDPGGAGYYHVMSRTVSDESGGMMFFGTHEKNVFAKQLRRHAEFAGIEVLTWCMMDNHFHLLIRVPEQDSYLKGIMARGRREFWKRLGAFHSREQARSLRREVQRLEAEGNRDREVEELLFPFTRRMADLSRFVQSLKFAFSVWFNRKTGREGTLWMRRFKSVLLEGEPSVLNKVAAYIDLNPVRAALVEDPGRYRWSGYGEAVGGKAGARKGLSRVYGYERNEWSRISRAYRKLLYLEGVIPKVAGGKPAGRRIPEGDFEWEMAKDADQGAVQRLAERVRYFSDGAVVGSKAFVETVFERNRALFGPRRKRGGRKLRGSAWESSGLFSLRDLTTK